MTPGQAKIAIALGQCSFLPASWDKRFANDIAFLATNSPELTERQASHLLRLAHKYRRQIPADVLESVLDEAEQAANRRVARGEGALADFTPARSRKPKRAPKEVALPLFNQEPL